eukprot:jgi/Galph1/1333/GphlegSOOS_G6000.1
MDRKDRKKPQDCLFVCVLPLSSSCFSICRYVKCCKPKLLKGCRNLGCPRNYLVNCCQVPSNKEDKAKIPFRTPQEIIRTLPPRLAEADRRKLWGLIESLKQEKEIASKEYRFEEAASLKERIMELMLQDPYACLELELQKAIEEERYGDAAIFSKAMKCIGEPPKLTNKDSNTVARRTPKTSNTSLAGLIPKDWPKKPKENKPSLQRKGILDSNPTISFFTEASLSGPEASGEEERGKESNEKEGEIDRSEYLRLEGFDPKVWEEGQVVSSDENLQSTANEPDNAKQKLFTYRELFQAGNKSEAVTAGIRVRVVSFFSKEESNIDMGIYTFGYRVEITNLSESTVQLISREWNIQEITGVRKKVVGTGVVGQQPVMLPGDSYEYTSKCPIRVASFFDPKKQTILVLWKDIMFSFVVKLVKKSLKLNCTLWFLFE